VLASLNHPNIAHIHGLEESSGTTALVMELVEGEDLAQRIAHGAIPLEEALAIARQIAEALEAAHESGIIHRDLKPANIKVRADGTVKVLDFGLAKALDAAGGTRQPAASGLAHSPTITSPALTQAGFILGTAAYMAPEQAKGRETDKRCDIWAFGVVLYEMLTGRALFAGESTMDVLGAVMRQPIDLALLPESTPASVRRLLRRCLEREPKQRLHDIADARIEIAEQISRPAADASAAPRPASRTRLMPLAGWALAVAMAAVALWARPWRDTTSATRPAYRFTIPRPAGDDSNPVISPNGRFVSYVSGDKVLVRAFDEIAPRELATSSSKGEPFWSPDSRSIGFFDTDGLKRVSIAGGPVERLATIPTGWPAGNWSSDGTIIVEVTENPDNEGWYVLSPGASSLKQIRAFGANRPVNPDKAFPTFLPDGDHFLFTHPVGDVATLQVGSVRSGETRALAPSDSRAEYAAPGFVFFVRNGTLLAQRFNADTLSLTGEPATVTDDIAFFSPTGEAGFSVSQEGTLIVRHRAGRSELRWLDREGRPGSALLGRDYYQDVAISADGLHVAAAIEDPRRSTTDLWVVDLERNVSTRLTSSPRSEWEARWSPDGSRLVFSTDWEGPPNLYVVDSGGGTPKVLVPFDRTQQYAGSWTPDARQVIYSKRNETFANDIWTIDVATGERRKVLATEFNEAGPTLSPNGLWLAYVSDASGRHEVYLRSFPGSEWQVRLSADGGRTPAWRKDGKELFYYQPSGAIMAVAIEPGASGRARPSLPIRLFPVDARVYKSFTVAPDGRRFLLNLADPADVLPPDEVIVDWARLIKK
jgi:serine/threonine protein kinase